MEAAAPNFVVEIPAILFAKFNASLIFKFFAKPTVKAPLNASPAPVVSVSYTHLTLPTILLV